MSDVEPELCPNCSEPWDWRRQNHPCVFRVPAWVLELSPLERLACGHLADHGYCSRPPADHLHTAKCKNDEVAKHHDWAPYPGSLVERVGKAMEGTG